MSLYYLILWNQVDILQKHFKKDHVHMRLWTRFYGIRRILFFLMNAIKGDIQYTVEREGLWDRENYLLLSDFLLYQVKTTSKYKELGSTKWPCYKRVLLIRPLYNTVEPRYNEVLGPWKLPCYIRFLIISG